MAFALANQQSLFGVTAKDELQLKANLITYQNDENGFCVIRTNEVSGNTPVTIVGTLLGVKAGMTIKAKGKWTEHKKYGKNFTVSHWHEIIPDTKEGVEAYLCSGLFKGIGKSTAKIIVAKFGARSIDVIENFPDELLTIKGIGKKKLADIKESWEQQKGIKDVMMFLQQNGVSTNLAVKIFKIYGDKSVERLRENPYRLSDALWGVGFKTADRIAMSIGIERDSEMRVSSGIMYALKELESAGNVCAYPKDLTEKACEILGVPENRVLDIINHMINAQELVLNLGCVYQPNMFTAENGIARLLKHIADSSEGSIKHTVDFEILEQETKMQYDEMQRKAIQDGVNQKVMVLTGGPGTGKTTTTNGIIKILADKLRKRVLLAAPTGRAAKRMTESTGKEAKTIHRLLEFNPKEGFLRNEHNPLEGDAIIVDESSMIDCRLMYSLLKAIPDHMKIILVGDIDQLPSVGAGNVLRDIIDSREFCVVALTKIFRQAQTSKIVTNAHLVNKGKMPDCPIQTVGDISFDESDFVMVRQDDAQQAAQDVVNLVSDILPSLCGVNPLQVQVLSPMRNGDVGTIVLNSMLQEALNKNPIVYKSPTRTFRMFDKVMQIRNNYNKGVFNGDIGMIKTCERDEDGKIVGIGIWFDIGIVQYDMNELDEIVLSYATTIHKSQGSEYPVVVMPLMPSHFVMLQRNLIYTGITRAKKNLVIVGNKKAVSIAVRNVTISKRNTNLAKRLSML